MRKITLIFLFLFTAGIAANAQLIVSPTQSPILVHSGEGQTIIASQIETQGSISRITEAVGLSLPITNPLDILVTITVRGGVASSDKQGDVYVIRCGTIAQDCYSYVIDVKDR